MPQQARAKVRGHTEPFRAHAMSLSMLVLVASVRSVPVSTVSCPRCWLITYTAYSATPIGFISDDKAFAEDFRRGAGALGFGCRYVVSFVLLEMHRSLCSWVAVRETAKYFRVKRNAEAIQLVSMNIIAALKSIDHM